MADTIPKLPIQMPLRGLDENYAFDVQAPGTTRNLLNVRVIDPKTGRTRIAQRSGLNRFLNDTTVSSSPIQDIIAVPKNEDELTWATDSAPDEVFAKALPGEEIGVDIVMDDFGNLYVAQQFQGVAKYNQDGALLATISVPDPDEPSGGSVLDIAFVHVDDFQNVYIGTAEGNAAPTANEQAAARLWAFEIQQDGSYLFAWSLNSGNFFPDAVTHRKADGTVDLICCENDYADGDAFVTVYPRFDFLTAPAEDTNKRVEIANAASGSTALMARRMAKRDDGVVYVAMTDNASSSVGQEIAKVNPYSSPDAGALVWLMSTDTAATGVGWGIAIGPTDTSGNRTIYSVGNKPASTGSSAQRVVDLGTASSNAGDAWTTAIDSTEFPEAAGPGARRLRLATDSEDNLYSTTPVLDTTYDVRIFDKDGTELNHFAITNAGSSVLGVAVPKDKPQGMTDASIEEAENVFSAGQLGGSSQGFFKNKMVTVTQPASAVTRPTRSLTFLSAAGGTIETFSQGGSFATPTGGSGALSATAPYIQSVVAMAPYDSDHPDKARQRVYYTDGISYKKYDPVDDTVTDWLSSTTGSIPPRHRLIELWQGRIVLARGPENAAAWHMSAIGDPENWDVLPQNPSPADAVSGVNAKAGDCPDIVNTLIPWDDDLLIFGCDHSIWVMRGNPLQGGQFDLLTDQHGMAWGRPWTKDHTGQVVYYMDNFGGVHALAKRAAPVRITRDRIERRLRDGINFDSHFVRLVWNREDEGLHVFQCPFFSDDGSWATTSVKAWFWDRKNDAWLEDQFGTSTVLTSQPTQVYLADGDQVDDRVLLLGCEDSRIRAWDRDAVSDDNSASTDTGTGSGTDLAIDSYVTIGPIQPRDSNMETQFQDFTAWLDSQQDGVHYSFFTDDEPENALNRPARYTGALNPGRNPTKLTRFTADTAYLRLRNANAAQRWAVERLTLGYVAAGEKKVRT